MLHAAPYDWRLSPTALEQRDGYFTRLKSAIETMVKLHGIRVALLAGHCTVFPFHLGCQPFYPSTQCR
jgi:hypothetical protein